MNLNRREFVGLAGAVDLAGGLPIISEPLAADKSLVRVD